MMGWIRFSPAQPRMHLQRGNGMRDDNENGSHGYLLIRESHNNTAHLEGSIETVI